MIYYVFDTENEAIAAENLIVNNIKSWVETYTPSVINDSGDAIIGRRPQTGEVASGQTSRWAIPKERLDGKWVFQKPTAIHLGPIPLSTVISGVTAVEQAYEDSWFPEPEVI